MSLMFNKNSNCLTVFLNGEMHTVPSDAANFKSVWDAIKTSNEELVTQALNVVEQIQTAFNSVVGSGVTVNEAGVFVNGNLMHNALSDRIMEFMSEGIPFDPLVKFLENFIANPVVALVSNPEVLALMGKSALSKNEVVNDFTNDFYAFLSHRNLPVTDDGCFLAYKAVDSNFWSKRGGETKLLKGKLDDQGRVYNAAGEEIECERGAVDPNRDAECSYGLHVGCLEYSGPGGSYNRSGDKTVIVKVNPRDVIAIPPDYNRTKMRVCAYTVVQEFKSALSAPLYVKSIRKDDESDLDDEFDDYEDQEDLDTYEGWDEDEEDVTGELDSAGDIYEGDEIRFDYVSSRGESKTRYLDVTETRDDIIIGKLLTPEEDAREYRSFKIDGISNVKLLN